MRQSLCGIPLPQNAKPTRECDRLQEKKAVVQKRPSGEKRPAHSSASGLDEMIISLQTLEAAFGFGLSGRKYWQISIKAHQAGHELEPQHMRQAERAGSGQSGEGKVCGRSNCCLQPANQNMWRK